MDAGPLRASRPHVLLCPARRSDGAKWLGSRVSWRRMRTRRVSGSCPSDWFVSVGRVRGVVSSHLTFAREGGSGPFSWLSRRLLWLPRDQRPYSVEGGVVVVLREGPEGFEVEYVDADDLRRRVGLAECWVEPFGQLPPVRTVRTHPGQESVTRQYSAATSQGPAAGGVAPGTAPRDAAGFRSAGDGPAAQPFRLLWPTRRGRRGHVPDFFVRRADGEGLVVDVCPDDRIEPDDAEAFTATARACELAGWRFVRVGAVDAMLLANVKWPAGCRHPRYGRPELRRAPLTAFAWPEALFAGAGGDRLEVLPVLYHLLWRQLLHGDLDKGMLGPDGMVEPAGRVRCVRSGGRPWAGPVGRVRFDSAVHTVLGISGKLVRLADGLEQSSAMHLPRLMTAPGFEAVGSGPRRFRPPGLLDGSGPDLAEKALRWHRHVMRC
ncbi:TnsA-like heteromeric transposase endonuclease subunit [Streptomyces sp. NPDC057623]|uniref:TnsA-like heteromeric transposase endonuclease subunit n=1 Tax=Streptomyces sp. NPDC057623 TaxID=3346187 RepID=UPI003678A44D